MNFLPGVVRLTADGLVGGSGKVIRVYSVHMVAASGTACVAILKEGTSDSGVATAQVNAAISSGSTTNFAGGLLFKDGCFCDVTFNSGDYITIIYTEQV